ncbi:unnamed protein product, partial [Symbiodinium natans]
MYFPTQEEELLPTSLLADDAAEFDRFSPVAAWAEMVCKLHLLEKQKAREAQQEMTLASWSKKPQEDVRVKSRGFSKWFSNEPTGRSGENRMPLVTVSESEVATASVAGRSGGYQTGASINETSQQSCGGIASAQPRKGHQTAACPIRGSETSPQTME